MLLPIETGPVLSILSMAVPMTNEQRKAAAALLRERVPEVAGIGRLFARHGYELALVGGPVRDVFLGERPSDLDLTTDATPEQVLAMAEGWADPTWTVGIAFGTVGLRKGSSIFEITTYRSEQYSGPPASPTCGTAGRWRRTWAAGTSPSTRWRPGCPATSSSTRSAASTR